MTKLLAVLGALTLVLAGCADDDDTGEPSEDTTTTTTTGDKGEGAGTPLTATLAGTAETDAGGEGTATVTLNKPKGEVCFEVSVSGLDAPTGMHIHKGAEGESGPVVIPLVQPESGDGTVDDCVTVEKSLIEQVATDPGGHYVNVHTGPFPDGAIRGQLGDGAAGATADNDTGGGGSSSY